MNKILLIFSIYLLFLLPKINLISVGNFSAGLRVDDLVIATIASVLVWRGAIKARLGPTLWAREERWFWTFFFVCLFSALYNTVVFDRSSLLFPLRFAEYFVFYYMGLALFSSGQKKIDKLVSVVFWANSAVAGLQILHVIGGFTVNGYRPDVSDRVIGLTSGPWELGVVLNIISCYFLARSDCSKTKKTIVFLISTLLILANGSRMSLMAQFAIILMVFVFSGGVVRALKGAIAAVPLLLAVAVILGSTTVADRSANLFSYENISSMQSSFASFRVTEEAPSWRELDRPTDSGDLDESWSIRVPKWIYAAKMWALNPGNMLWGVGPGTFGNALDGGWLRLLSETGILGVLFFILMIKTIYGYGGGVRLMVVALSINLFFIDIYMAYKVMSILFFMLGCTRAERIAGSVNRIYDNQRSSVGPSVPSPA
ncbi:MAG: hypothetical protein QM581_11125 [Pseudomonas sp.]